MNLRKQNSNTLVNNVFDAGETFRKDHSNEEIKSWSSSNRTKIVVTFLQNNRNGPEAFLESPYGIMHNNRDEQSFRKINILCSTRIANNTNHGEETLTRFYNPYCKTSV